MIITSASEPIITTGWKIRLNTSLRLPNQRLFLSHIFARNPGASLSIARTIDASGAKDIHIQSLNILMRLTTINTNIANFILGFIFLFGILKAFFKKDAFEIKKVLPKYLLA